MKIRNIILSAMFIALGLVLPMAIHSVAAGPVLLPMHIIVLLAGIFLPFYFALAVAILIPLLNFLLTGMPPLFPGLCYMLPEIVTYGIVIHLLYHKAKWNIHFALIGSMAAGRIVVGGAVWLLVQLFAVKLASPLAFVSASVVTGLPGILLQLVIIPAVVLAVQKMQKKSTIHLK